MYSHGRDSISTVLDKLTGFAVEVSYRRAGVLHTVQGAIGGVNDTVLRLVRYDESWIDPVGETLVQVGAITQVVYL